MLKFSQQQIISTITTLYEEVNVMEYVRNHSHAQRTASAVYGVKLTVAVPKVTTTQFRSARNVASHLYFSL